jgi:hypothetical protein
MHRREGGKDRKMPAFSATRIEAGVPGRMSAMIAGNPKWGPMARATTIGAGLILTLRPQAPVRS